MISDRERSSVIAAVCVAIALIVFAYCAGENEGRKVEQARAAKAGAGAFVADPRTGASTFSYSAPPGEMGYTPPPPSVPSGVSK